LNAFFIIYCGNTAASAAPSAGEIYVVELKGGREGYDESGGCCPGVSVVAVDCCLCDFAGAD
jgi:hypothetical protein